MVLFKASLNLCNEEGFHLKHKNIIPLFRDSDIPFINICFDDKVDNIEYIKIQDALLGTWKDISLQELKDVFKKFGVPINDNPCYKAINDKKSSAYHNWQRENLGNITVSDIDLIRVSEGRIQEIVELKRSFLNVFEF